MCVAIDDDQEKDNDSTERDHGTGMKAGQCTNVGCRRIAAKEPEALRIGLEGKDVFSDGDIDRRQG
jgi:hypothetical protein